MLDYKSVFKSRRARSKILRMLRFIPDKPMLRVQYWLKTGRILHLHNPRRFTEKLQWYKLYYRNPLMIQCVDKYEVREYVKRKGLEEILIPCYGVFNDVSEIDWNILPDKFVMKDTLGGGGNRVIIVKDKNGIEFDRLKEKASKWTKTEVLKNTGGREWPYYSGKNHRIILEKYLQGDKIEGGLVEYKFFCFNGNPRCLYVLADREFGVSVGLEVFDENFIRKGVTRNDEKPLKRDIKKPVSFELMKSIAAKLSEDFPEARVDLYEENGNVYFGEITFFDGSGYMTYTPDSFDFELGKFFELRTYT